MKRNKNLVLTASFFLLSFGWTFGARDSQGTEFIIGFMQNTPLETPIELLLTTTSSQKVNVTISTPLFNPNLRRSATLTKGTVSTIYLPKEIRGYGVEKSNKGVWIQSTDEVTVYGVNKESKSTDSYLALPVDTLGWEYFALTYVQDAEVLVVATENDTRVSITLPKKAGPCQVVYGRNTYRNGDTFNVTLNRFETFHLVQFSLLSDFTGTHIVSSKPIAVISGNVKVPVPAGAGSADHLTEMLTPVDTWGRRFLTTSTPDRNIGDVFRVVASDNDTHVSLSNGSSYVISSPGDFLELDIPTGYNQAISTDHPVQMAMFSKTFKDDGPNYGDPSMTLIVPEPQYASDYTWSSITDPTGAEFSNAITVVIAEAQIAGLRMDGRNVTWRSQKEIPGSDGKMTLWTRVTPGVHNIFHLDPTVTFLALVSGNYKVNSYAYAAGMRVAQINAECSRTQPIPGDIIDNDCDGWIDEEILNGMDDDGDGEIDEDLAFEPRDDPENFWSEWNEWVTASGFQSRTRNCTYPDPKVAAKFCAGNATETRECPEGYCPGDPLTESQVAVVVLGVVAGLLVLLGAAGAACMCYLAHRKRNLGDTSENAALM